MAELNMESNKSSIGLSNNESFTQRKDFQENVGQGKNTSTKNNKIDIYNNLISYKNIKEY